MLRIFNMSESVSVVVVRRHSVAEGFSDSCVMLSIPSETGVTLTVSGVDHFPIFLELQHRRLANKLLHFLRNVRTRVNGHTSVHPTRLTQMAS